jgi:amidophosphoribosyltransferase
MCGVVGVKILSGESLAVDLAIKLILRLQHRGQDGAGLSAFYPAASGPGRFETLRGLGLIDHALRDWQDMEASGTAVAHTRYATTGQGGVGELQPFVKGAPRVSMAHNGNIVNCEELIEKHQIQVDSESDLDVLQQVFLKKRTESFEAAVSCIEEDFIGSYAVVGMEDDGTLFGFRDPFGIRPLFLGQSPRLAALASETSALATLGTLEGPSFKVLEIGPGEWVRVSPQGEVTRGQALAKAKPRRFCMFEMVYFSSPQSEYGKASVYRQRFQLGRQVALEIQDRHEGTDVHKQFDYVVPVPDTSRAAAIAVAETLGVPYREYLVKNPYVSRTFILGRQDQRLKALESKLSLIGPEIKGQKILLVDDSVVRGNTSRLMATRLREAGAQAVSIASTCPPIRHGCFYGIDFPDARELVACQHDDLEGVRQALGVDGLYYISQEGLQKALGTKELCMACLDGDYPARNSSFDLFLSKRRDQRGTTA